MRRALSDLSLFAGRRSRVDDRFGSVAAGGFRIPCCELWAPMVHHLRRAGKHGLLVEDFPSRRDSTARHQPS